jgi:hypothetical protein
VRGEGVAEGVTTPRLLDPGLPDGALHILLRLDDRQALVFKQLAADGVARDPGRPW